MADQGGGFWDLIADVLWGTSSGPQTGREALTEAAMMALMFGGASAAPAVGRAAVPAVGRAGRGAAQRFDAFDVAYPRLSEGLGIAAYGGATMGPIAHDVLSGKTGRRKDALRDLRFERAATQGDAVDMDRNRGRRAAYNWEDYNDPQW